MHRTYTEYLRTGYTLPVEFLKHHLAFIFLYNLSKSNCVVMKSYWGSVLGGERKTPGKCGGCCTYFSHF